MYYYLNSVDQHSLSHRKKSGLWTVSWETALNSTVMGFGYMNVVYRHLITCDVDMSSEDCPKHTIAASFVVDSW